MDLLFWLHLAIIGFVLSVPFWDLEHLRFGVYVPLLLTTIWLLCDGCPLTAMHNGGNDGYFAQTLLRPFFPNITREQTSRFAYYVLIIITYASAWRLSGSKWHTVSL